MTTRNTGFTLLEILLVVAAIGILASIVIVAINPTRQIQQFQNAQRSSHVNSLSSAIVQYIIDGNILPTLAADGTTVLDADTDYEICFASATGAGEIKVTDFDPKLVSLYIGGIPSDPTASTATCTGYTYAFGSGNRITIKAPEAALDAVIEVTR